MSAESTKVGYLAMDRYDQRHGGPWDRGSADSYYGRGRSPHYFKGATHSSECVNYPDMTAAEVEAYDAGYYWNEQYGDKKQWD